MSARLREVPARPDPEPASGLLPLFRELGDLKRVTSAAAPGSIAARLFGQAWVRLVGGEPVDEVAYAVTGAALAAARLGDLDGATLVRLGLAPAEALAVLRAGLDEVAAPLDPVLSAVLRDAIALPREAAVCPPAFVEILARQPRAGATCPGRPRIMLLPAENHAEHCLVTALYGVLLSPGYGADAPSVFLAALAHHLHNAGLPDSGFAGETLLGPHLVPMMERATAGALAELPPGLRSAVAAARRILPDAATPEGRAFHAADVLDRVLEIRQHLDRAQVTMDDVLGEMSLVHDGPVKPFHEGVLRAMGLA